MIWTKAKITGRIPMSLSMVVREIARLCRGEPARELSFVLKLFPDWDQESLDFISDEVLRPAIAEALSSKVTGYIGPYTIEEIYHPVAVRIRQLRPEILAIRISIRPLFSLLTPENLAEFNWGGGDGGRPA